MKFTSTSSELFTEVTLMPSEPDTTFLAHMLDPVSVHGERVAVVGKAGKHYSVTEMGTNCTGAYHM